MSQDKRFQTVQNELNILFQQLNKDPKVIDRVAKIFQSFNSDVAIRKLIIQEFLLQFTQSILNSRYFQQYEPSVQNYLEIALLAIISDNHPKLSETFQLINDSTNLLYQGYDLNQHQFNTTYILNYFTEEYDKFIKQLKENDQVDYILNNKWKSGRITSVQQNQFIINHLILKAGEIMPYKSRNTLKLSVDQYIDVRVNYGGIWLWTKQKIVGQNNKGEFILANKIIFDESSQNIAPPDCYSGRKNYYQEDELYLEDFKKKKFYAVMRKAKSPLQVRLINFFGEQNGFEWILQRIQKGIMPIESLVNFVTGIWNSSDLFFVSFLDQYIFKLAEAIYENIGKLTEVNLRNFTLEQVYAILKNMEDLLKRVTISKEWKEKMLILLVKIFFNCQFLDKKLCSLKFLKEIIQLVQEHNFSTLNNEGLYRLIKELKLFGQLFNPEVHPQLLTRSNDLLAFLMNQGFLEQKECEILWDMMQIKENELNGIVYKLISGIQQSIKEDICQFFLLKFKQIQKLTIEQLQLLYDISKQVNKQISIIIQHQNTILDAIKMYWQIIDSSNEENIQNQSINLLYSLTSLIQSKELKIQLIQDMIKNLKNKKHEVPSLKVILLLIESFKQQNEQLKIIQEIESNHKITQILLANLEEVKKRSSKSESSLKDSIQISYFENFFAIIKLFVNAHLDLQVLNTLWNQFVNEKRYSIECLTMCHWVQELMKDNLIDCEEFFKKNFIENKTNPNQVTEEVFECFQELILRVNLKKNLIFKQNYMQSNNIQIKQNLNGKIISIRNIGPRIMEQNDVTIYFIYFNQNQFPYIVQVSPENLIGIDYLWEIIYNNSTVLVIEKAINFLIQTMINVSLKDMKKKIITQLVTQIVDRLKVGMQKQFTMQYFLTTLLLIKVLLNESEKKGIGSLKSLGRLSRGELLTLKIKKELFEDFELKIHSNKTLYELKQVLAKHIKLMPETITISKKGLLRSPKQFSDSDNSKSLSDLRIKQNEIIFVHKKQPQYIQPVPLLDSQDQMVPVLKNIVTEWFKQYSTNEMMNQEQLAEFFSRCYGKKCTIYESTVDETFKKYDSDEDGSLELQDFLNFYTNNCKQCKEVVYQNLNAFNYRNDLKKEKEEEIEQFDETWLPRYIFANHKEFFTYLFTLLDGVKKLYFFMLQEKVISDEAWLLLNRLPVSEVVMNKILNLEGVKVKSRNNQRDWSQVLPIESPYRLHYFLKIIEYLMSDLIEDDEEQQHDQKQTQWREEFIEYGGFEQLSQVFKKYQQNDNYTIMSFIIHILKTYLTATLMSTMPQIYKIQQYLSLCHLQEIKEMIKNEYNQKDNSTQIILVSIRIKETDDFHQLVKSLQGRLGNMILATLDMPSLFLELINLINKISLNDQENTQEQLQIVEQGCKNNFVFININQYVYQCKQFFIIKMNVRNNFFQKIFQNLFYYLEFSVKLLKLGNYFQNLYIFSLLRTRINLALFF